MAYADKILEKPNFSSEEKKEKLERFRYFKDRLAKITGKPEKTQGEFNEYIKNLPSSLHCKYMTGIKEILSLCNNNLFECRFRSEHNFKIQGKLKFECQRKKMLELKNLL